MNYTIGVVKPEDLSSTVGSFHHTKFKIDKKYPIVFPTRERDGWYRSCAKVLMADDTDLGTSHFIPPKILYINGKKHTILFVFEDVSISEDKAKIGYIYKPDIKHLREQQETMGWRVIIWKEFNWSMVDKI
jgi:hypothetical protein